MSRRTISLRALLGLALAILGAPAASAAPQTPTPTELMDWAERSYPQFFPGHQVDRTLAPYVYRHYPATGNYVGVAGDAVYVLGPVAGGGAAPVQVGVLANFACQVHPGSCTDTVPTGENDCDDLTLTKVSSYAALRRHEVIGFITFDVHESRGALQQVQYRGKSVLSWPLRHETTGPGAGDRSVTDDRWYFERSGARSYAFHGQVQDQVSTAGGTTRRSRVEFVWEPPWMSHDAALSPGQDYTVTVQSNTTQTVDGVTTGPTAEVARFRTRFVGYETISTAGAGSFPACRFEADWPDAPGSVSVVWTWRGYGVELEREVRVTQAGIPSVAERWRLMSLMVNGQPAR